MKKSLSTIGLLLIMIANYSLADTLVLKSGKKIVATKCWEQGDLVKCQLHGQTIGYAKTDIAEVQMDALPAKPVDGFRFDMWNSGITVAEAINVAETNDKAFHASGIISANKSFHPKMCRPYADTATKFCYKDQIFGKWATLNFDFTPTSKRLYCLDVGFFGPGISKQSEFRERIEAMLREKYGKPVSVTDHIVYKTYDWKINSHAMVTMRPGCNSVNVIYRDITLARQAEAEKLDQVRKGFTTNDKGKF